MRGRLNVAAHFFARVTSMLDRGQPVHVRGVWLIFGRNTWSAEKTRPPNMRLTPWFSAKRTSPGKGYD